mgnify:CR=1 FL=1
MVKLCPKNGIQCSKITEVFVSYSTLSRSRNDSYNLIITSILTLPNNLKMVRLLHKRHKTEHTASSQARKYSNNSVITEKKITPPYCTCIACHKNSQEDAQLFVRDEAIPLIVREYCTRKLLNFH